MLKILNDGHMWTTRDIFSPPSQCGSTIVWKIHVSTRLVCLWVVSSQNAKNDWTISCLSEHAWWFLCWNWWLLLFTIIASRTLLHLFQNDLSHACYATHFDLCNVLHPCINIKCYNRLSGNRGGQYDQNLK